MSNVNAWGTLVNKTDKDPFPWGVHSLTRFNRQ